jgi:WhiB family transcriptional regulator, redox-sensing transcriptional regulator
MSIIKIFRTRETNTENLAELINRDPNLEQPLCQESENRLFFPLNDESPEIAKAICAVCPVRNLCFDYAIDNSIRFGIWGGTTSKERRTILRQERIYELGPLISRISSMI